MCKWGKNADYSSIPKATGKRVKVAATIFIGGVRLEVILGWWMVTDDERLDEVLDFMKSSGWLGATTVECGLGGKKAKSKYI